MIRKKKKISTNGLVNVLFKSKSFYGGFINKIDKNILPFIYGKRNDILIINLKYTNIFIKKIFNLIKFTFLKKKKILIISNSNDSDFLIDDIYIKNNEFIIYFNKKWINGNITNKNIDSVMKNNEINLIFIYKISNIYFNKELFSLKTPIISLIDPSQNLNNINYPLIVNLTNIKSLYSLLYIFRKIF